MKLGYCNNIYLEVVLKTSVFVLVQLLPFVSIPRVVAQSIHKNTLEQPITAYQVVVNSNQDYRKPDDDLTLREAIEIVNGTLKLEELSTTEKAQVEKLTTEKSSRIEFDLSPSATTIRLFDLLPPLASPGLIIDGTTQTGYELDKSATAEIEIPIPVVAITPAEQAEVFRGLTIVADHVVVRGLSLYGFTSQHRATVFTPPADIFISHPLPPPNTTQQQPPASYFPFRERDVPPKSIIIENNWLGIPPDEKMPATTSAFGVSVFNSLGTTIRRNRIAFHDGSGIITSVQAQNLQVRENIIVGNGMAGMPDAIRLEGKINQTQIASNLICGNDGSGVYLFKPEGAVEIRDNQIKYNGRRLRRAAIYLMGNDHQVMANQIGYQTGPGVVIAAYPQSVRNLIQDNQFSAIEGLSIDLNTRHHVEARDYQVGDGANPMGNSRNRRQDTANGAVSAPQWLSPEFFKLQGQVNLDGIADPGSQVDIYLVKEAGSQRGPLNEPLATVQADQQGKFAMTLTNLKPGSVVSAIATHPEYGTSEPALNTVVRAIGKPDNREHLERLPAIAQEWEVPQCTTKPVVVQLISKIKK
ncbi:MAG: right-handed parallel beta-helix repeat-containing protein [Symploca sp. SIO3C6]|nr:right-handed parallel beta-helix repeat-containing protein [Symploca sp. SIO3C6]